MRKIYHYTNIDVLYDVLKEQKFWLTRYDYLNDMTELEYSFTLIESNINKVCIKLSSDEKMMLMACIKNLSEYIYIMSFSTNSDSLTLWGNYSAFEGYYIGMNSLELANYIIKNKIFIISNDKSNEISRYRKEETKSTCYNIGKVIYDQTEQNKMIVEVLECLNELYSSSMRQSDDFSVKRAELISHLVDYCCMFKKTCFYQEEEYRLIVSVDKNINSNVVKYKKSKSVFIPYIEIGFDLNVKESIIKSIGIGPKNKMDIAEKGLISYLMSLDYEVVNPNTVNYNYGNKEVDVIKSGIPLRY